MIKLKIELVPLGQKCSENEFYLFPARRPPMRGAPIAP